MEPWAKGSHEYAQRARPERHGPAAEAPSPIPEESRRNLADCAVTWDDRQVDLDRIRPTCQQQPPALVVRSQVFT